MSQMLASIQPLALALLVWLGKALLFGTLLAGLTWLPARLLRRKIPPAFEVALWTIVLVRFLIPLGPGWSWSLPSLFQAAVQSGPIAGSSLGLISAELATANPLLDEPAEESLTGAAAGGISWLTILALTYLACVTVLLLWRGRRHRALLTYCRALPPADRRTRALVSDICRRFGVRRVPSVRRSRGRGHRR